MREGVENMTIDKAYMIFINDKKVSCSDETVAYYSYNVGKFIDYLVEQKKRAPGDIDVTEVDRDLLNGFILKLRSANRYAGHPSVSSDRRIKNTSINTYLRAVKIFMGWCFREDFIDRDVFRSVRFPKQDAETIVPLYQDEAAAVDAMFDRKTEAGLRDLCIIHLMLDAGCRRGEVVGLRFRDLFFDKNILYVYGKGGKYRIVPLCPALKGMLYRYCVLYRSYPSDGCDPEQSVFLNLDGRSAISKSTINQLFRRIRERTGIERLHPHLLRHTFATSYVMGGGNLEFLRMIMGHSDYNVTRRYLHLANQCGMMGAGIYQLDPVFFKNAY